MILDNSGILVLSALHKPQGMSEHDPAVRCADHPDAAPADGFGLGGGGFGVYTYCPTCGYVLTKTEIEE